MNGTYCPDRDKYRTFIKYIQQCINLLEGVVCLIEKLQYLQVMPGTILLMIVAQA